MLFLSTKDLIPNLSLTTSFPRVEHLARCGTHFKGGKCGIDEQDYKFFEDLNKKLRVRTIKNQLLIIIYIHKMND